MWLVLVGLVAVRGVAMRIAVGFIPVGFVVIVHDNVPVGRS
jgi:hypothetical protein